MFAAFGGQTHPLRHAHQSLRMKTCSTITALATAALCGLGTSALAQDADEQVSYTPEHMWEVGFHGGYAFLSGDLDQDPGFGAGLHVRRALDHIFSLRVDVDYLRVNTNEGTDRADFDYNSVSTTTVGGAAHGVVTVNNLKFDKPSRKINLYIFGGPGASSIEIQGELKSGGEENLVEARNLNGVQFFAEAGAGIAFKVSRKFNIGLEHKGMIPFGRTADLFDADRNVNQPGTSYRDIPNYTNLRFNFNIGSDDKAEPLYWVNPLNQVIEDLTELKARPELDLTDSDGDGVIDMIDQDPDSPEGAEVDPRGIPLDSDDDGIPNYEDAEPYSPPGAVVDATGASQDPGYQTRPQVEELIANALTDYSNSEAANMEDWFLPMIHFALNSYTIRKADYGHLKNIATVLRTNPNTKVVVQGYTDKLASDDYNRVLSYNRAKAAKEYLVGRYNISPDRLLINYDGESDVLVPTNSSSFMNRRVEFRIATNEDTEMAAPDGPKAGTGTFFEGSRDAGY